jgi:CrcB protein
MRPLLLAVGGALGTLARHYASAGMLRWMGPAFPYGTLLVNVIGSFLLGLFMQLSLSGVVTKVDTRLFLTTGFCGGFTTYSTFNYETTRLFQNGQHGLAALNVVVTLITCLVGGLLGAMVGRLFSRS